jgi:hypothetical protein
VSDQQRPAVNQAPDHQDPPSALQAVQAALDRRDNGGATDRLAPAAAADGGD